MKLRTEILATDGKLTKRLLWIERSRGGIQAGWHSKGFPNHLTYHSDGKRYETMGDSPAEFDRWGPPLYDFKGIEQLSAFVIPHRVDEISEEPPYRMKKLDAIIHVDVRSYPEGGIVCDVYLLEPDRFDLIGSELISFLPMGEEQPAEYHLLTMVRPWLLVTIAPAPVPSVPFNPRAKIKEKEDGLACFLGLFAFLVISLISL